MDNEIVKLTNVLRRIARAAGYAAWVKADPDARHFCVGQYNRVRARILELEPAIATLFTPLPEDASLEVTRIAARDLAAYFEDEAPEAFAFQFQFGCRPKRYRYRSRWAGVSCQLS